MLELLSLFDSGKIAPHMSAVYGLEDGSRALDNLAGRRAQGKVVIRCG
jgi:NADPH:quinone reductase-like Zn-dependent oxidoreductase